MCLLFETIRIDDGIPRHLSYHMLRMIRSIKAIFPGHQPEFAEPLLVVPDEFREGAVRCNIHYDNMVRKVSFSRYDKKPVRSLQMVKGDDIDYHLKFSDRTTLAHLYSMRGSCDDILIIQHGRITDTSMANIIFFDGDRWVTPSRPLLAGTCRERLINTGIIVGKDIYITDLQHFKGWKIVNAMRWPEEESTHPMDHILDIS
jgi:4-amino-4-deoxychorismate lyase